jgi:putative peptidoglycan lipid II flippase
VLAHFLGNSEAADAFYAALKIPNFPQNLLGEGVLSASFIPVYANLIARGESEKANRVAGAIFSLLSLMICVIVMLGIWGTPLFIDLVAPGFEGEKRALTITLVRIIFPSVGFLVLSAWCLGILNSHHKFFLSYVAPVIWNGAVIAVLFYFRHETVQSQVAVHAAWGLVLGAVLQFLLQLPTTLKLVPDFKFTLGLQLEAVREIAKNFVPIVISRGVVQLSGYVDSILASFLPGGAVAALGYAQAIYLLPISLFGMSISAAELPTMSMAYGTENFNEVLRTRINSASKRIAFFIIPSAVGLFMLGDAISSLLYQSGKFDQETSNYVWSVLAGSAVGLFASTLGRLYSSTFYSLRDTKTPLRYSIIRVLLTTVLGYFMGLVIPDALGISLTWGTAGLTASAGIAGWVEFVLLRQSLNRVIGKTGVPVALTLKLWTASLLSGAAGFFVKTELSSVHPAVRGLCVLLAFGFCYFPITALIGVEDSRFWLRKIRNVLAR